jgi:hypothetical protein
MSIYQLDLIENYQKSLTKMWTCTNDQLKSLADMTSDLIVHELME